MEITFVDVFTVVLKAIMSIAIFAFSVVVLPWIKKTAIPWLKDKRLYGTVRQFVNAAEKLADAGKLSKECKKGYVIKLLANMGIVVDERIDAMIESAVIELDIAFSDIIYELDSALDEDEEDAYDTCDAEECADA